MKDESLNLLSKKELIEIIKSDNMWRARAFAKVNKFVYNKINSIIDEMEGCKINTKEGFEKYKELDKEYKKWIKIQANL